MFFLFMYAAVAVTAWVDEGGFGIVLIAELDPIGAVSFGVKELEVFAGILGGETRVPGEVCLLDESAVLMCILYILLLMLSMFDDDANFK